MNKALEIQKEINEIFPFDMDKDLFEQNVNSLSFMKIIAKVKQQFGVEIDVEEFLKNPNMQYLNQLIQSQLAEKKEIGTTEKKGDSDLSVSEADLVALLDEVGVSDSIDFKKDLFEQGLTSLNIMQLIVKIKNHYGVEVSLEEFFQKPVLQDLMTIISTDLNLQKPMENLKKSDMDRQNSQKMEVQPIKRNIVSNGKNGESLHCTEDKLALGIFASKEHKEEFIRSKQNIRSDQAIGQTIPGKSDDVTAFASEYTVRRSYREFEEDPVFKEDLLGWLSALNAIPFEGNYKYRYPSAGGTYSVQVYIEVKPEKVQDLTSGLYYYHPIEHSLKQISQSRLTPLCHFYYNRPFYKTSHFCLYFVAEYKGIKPIYGDKSQNFVSMEAGVMCQLLMERQSLHQIGSCIVAGMKESFIKKELSLSDSHQVLLGMVCGKVSFPDSLQSKTLPPNSNVSQIRNHTFKEIPIKRVPDRYPLSEGQKGLWAIQKTFPDISAYNCPLSFSLNGKIDINKLQQSFEMVLQQYPILKTVIGEEKGVPFQSIAGSISADIRQEDVSSLSPGEIPGLLKQRAKDPFNLSSDPLVRIHLFTSSEQDPILMLCAHHIVTDGGSFLPIISTFFHFYSGLLQGKDIVPEPSLSSWHQRVEEEATMLEGEEGEHRLSYWKQQLQAAPPMTRLYADASRNTSGSYKGTSYLVKLPKHLNQEVSVFARSHSISLSTLFLSIYKALVYRYSGQQDLVTGVPVDTRITEEERKQVGYYVNMIPVRIQIEEGKTFLDTFELVHKTVLSGLAHSLPFPHLVKKLNISSSLDSSPLFQMGFAYQNFDMSDELSKITQPFRDQFSVDCFEEVVQEGEYELMFEVLEQEETSIKVKYNPDVYSPTTISRFVEHYIKLLQDVLEKPNAPVQNYSLLSDSESSLLLNDWNNTQKVEERKCLHQLFEEQVERTPKSVAVVFQEQKLTYEDLNIRSNQLAHCLQQLGAEPGSLVGICMERSVEMIVGLFGILKAGGAYVPLDPDYPKQRLDYILEDTQAPILLIQEKFKSTYSDYPGKIVVLDVQHEKPKPQFVVPSSKGITSDDLCYVLYTSGSTGKPKGCMLSHGSIHNRLQWMQDQYALKAQDKVLQKTPYSFDVSVWEFFWPLITGASLIFAKPEGHKDPEYLSKLIQDEEITTCHFVPSMLQSFIEAKQVEKCTSLDRIFTSGEALPYALFEKTNQKLKAKVHNLYGPTEASVDVSYWEACERQDRRIPIGRPIANTQLHVVDSKTQLVPIGVPGELLIGGEGLAKGYLNRPELTKEKFIADPFSSNNHSRLYRTGDLVRWLPEGNLEYLGRIDTQVKIRGFRVELTEIEDCILQSEQVRECAVVVCDDPSDSKFVAAYVVPEQREEINISELRQFIRTRLPEFMVPSIFVRLDALPVTTNGKLDRSALPAPKSAIATDKDSLLPQTDLEQKIANIWKQSLQIEKVGVDDSFFEIGGHSLSAISMISQVIDEIKGSNISQVTFYKDPTIRGLVGQISSTTTADSLVSQLLQSKEETSFSLVCVPYAGATAAIYQALATELAHVSSDISAYGISSMANEFGTNHQSSGNLQDLARDCVEEILEKTSGRIGIYGHCVGSYLALEITRQLERKGKEVSFLLAGGAFPLPNIIKYLPMEDRWKNHSDASLHKRLKKWGFPDEEIKDDILSRILTNFRRDAKLAFQYEKTRGTWKINAPIVNLVSDDDPLTKNYRKKYLSWKRCSDLVHLMVLNKGKHYFVDKCPELVAEVVANLYQNTMFLSQQSSVVTNWESAQNNILIN